MPEIEIDGAQHKPLRVSLGFYVVIQLAISCGAIGIGYATVKRDISEHAKAIEEIQKQRNESVRFENEALQRLVRMEVTLEDMKERLRGRR